MWSKVLDDALLYVQDATNRPFLQIFEGTFSLDVAHFCIIIFSTEAQKKLYNGLKTHPYGMRIDGLDIGHRL